MNDFNAPVKYSAPEPSERNMMPLIIGVVVLVVAGLGYGAFTMLKGGGGGGLLMGGSKREGHLTSMLQVAPAKVEVGTAKTWRTLAETKHDPGRNHYRPPAIVGHFGGGKDNDVLLLGISTATKVSPTYIYSADGSKHQVADSKFYYVTRYYPWDMNHDGVDELVPESRGLAYMRLMNFPVISFDASPPNSGWPIETADGQRYHSQLDLRDQQTPVYNLNGDEKSELAGGFTFGQLILGDMDGDGRQDLLVKLKKVVDTFQINGANSQRSREIQPQFNAKSAFCADLDGSGHDSLINMEGSELVAYNFKGDHTSIPGFPTDYYPCKGVDVTGDKIDEVFAVNNAMQNDQTWDQGRGQFKYPDSGLDKTLPANDWLAKNAVPRGGYFNPKTKAWVAFQFPKGPNWNFNIFQGVDDELAIGDFDGDGKPEIAARASAGSALFIFDLAGKCIYYEEFGMPVVAMGNVRSKGKDHLMLETEQKVLIYP